MKRKIICWVLLVAVLLPLFSVLPVSAAEEDASWYFHEETGLLYIYGAKSLYRQEYYSRYKWDKEKVKILIVEEGVQEIGTGFFAEHTNLKEVYLPKSLKIVGYNAFACCSSLEEIRIPNQVKTIDVGAFMYCTALQEISLPSDLTSLGKLAFLGCSSLRRISLPDGLTKINEGTFKDCTALESITFPEGMVSIGKAAFCSCSSLQAVSLPASLTTVEKLAFANCIKLRAFTLAPENSSFLLREGALCSPDGKTLIAVPTGHVGTYAIPEGVEIVGDFACAGADLITELEIPSSVKIFRDGAFLLCDRLMTVSLPKNVEAVYSGAFRFIRCVRVENAECSLANGTLLWIDSERKYGWGNAIGVGETCSVYGLPDSSAERYANQFSCTFYDLSEWENRTEIPYEPLPDWALQELPPVEPDESYAPSEPVERPPLPDDYYMKFSDVDKEDWYYSAVLFAVKNGLFNGTSQNTFSPDEPMTRAMLVTVLWRYAGEPEAEGNLFTDVPFNSWYAEAVAWAAANGVVNGVGAGRFDPEGTVTREQLATILYRYSAGQELDVSARTDLTTFPDGGKVSGYASEALSWAVAQGLVTGVKEGDRIYLDPQGSATRAQVAAILMRYIEKVSK